MFAPCQPLAGPVDGAFFEWGNVCVPPGSLLWSLPPGELHAALARLRPLAEYNSEADDVGWLLANGDGQVPPLFTIRRRYRRAIERAGLNPFLTDAQKVACADAFEQMLAWLRRRIKSRARRRSGKRGSNTKRVSYLNPSAP